MTSSNDGEKGEIKRTFPLRKDHRQQQHQRQNKSTNDQQFTLTMVEKSNDNDGDNNNNNNDAGDDKDSPPLLLVGVYDSVVYQLQAWRDEFCCTNSPPNAATMADSDEASKVGGGVNADDATIIRGDSGSTIEAGNERDDKDETEGNNNNKNEIVNDTLLLDKAHRAISDALVSCSPSSSRLVDGKVKTLVKSLCSMYYKTFHTLDYQHRRRRLEDVQHSNNDEKLKQLEWHIHLLLDVWTSAKAQAQTTQPKEGRGGGGGGSPNDEIRSVEKVLAEAILEAHDEYQRSSSSSSVLPPTKKQRKKQKMKQSAKSRNQNTSSFVDHHNDHRQIVLDHLVETLSRAAFLLPATLPFGDFVSLRCLNVSHHWDALPQTVSYLYDSFEVANPFLSTVDDDNDDDDDDDDTSFINDGNAVIVNRPPTGQQSNNNDFPPAPNEKQTKRERQGVGKTTNNPKKRLKSLLNKPRFKGSRFNDGKIRSLGALSKILDETPTCTIGRDTGKRNRTGALRTTNNDLRKGNLGQEATCAGRVSRVKHNTTGARTTSERQSSRSKHGSAFPSFVMQKDRPSGGKCHSTTAAMPPPPIRNMDDTNDDNNRIITTPKKDASWKTPTLHRASETPSRSEKTTADLLFSPSPSKDTATSASDNLLPSFTLFGISSKSTLSSRKYSSSTSIASKKGAMTKHGDRSTTVDVAADGGSGNAAAVRNYIRRKST